MFWVRAESLLAFLSACTNLHVFPRAWEGAAHEDTLDARYPKGSLSDCTNGRERVRSLHQTCLYGGTEMLKPRRQVTRKQTEHFGKTSCISNRITHYLGPRP